MKTVKVFISSTFTDMNAERDILARQVFPRLRERLMSREDLTPEEKASIASSYHETIDIDRVYGWIH
jgi:hypothetical protein